MKDEYNATVNLDELIGIKKGMSKKEIKEIVDSIILLDIGDDVDTDDDPEFRKQVMSAIKGGREYPIPDTSRRAEILRQMLRPLCK